MRELAARLSKAKRSRINAFFNDRDKTETLREKKRRAGGDYNRQVFELTLRNGAGGKQQIGPEGSKPQTFQAIAKVTSWEREARWNQLMLARQFRMAVRQGRINPTLYDLKFVRYLHADDHVGVMERIDGVPLYLLHSLLKNELNPSRSNGESVLQAYERNLKNNAQNYKNLRLRYQPDAAIRGYVDRFRRYLDFARAHQEIKPEMLMSALDKLSSDLKMVTENRATASSDVHYNDNIIVTGLDEKTGRLHFTLVDSVDPNDIDKVAQRYKKKLEEKKILLGQTRD